MGHGLFLMATPSEYCVDYPLNHQSLDVLRLLHQHGLHPDKSLGQNFLFDENALRQIVDAACISPNDVVLEIGAGVGSLTRHLAQYALTVVAVELDARLIHALKQVVAPYPNVVVVHGDILALEPARLVSQQHYLVVANIPYNITSALIRHLLEAEAAPDRLILTIQREVAERICAAPGDLSLLSLSVQVYGRPEIITHIPASAFYPAPNVDSSVLRIELFPSPMIPDEDLEIFFKIIKAGFSQKRKTLRNSLAGGLRLSPSVVESLLITAKIDPMRRAQTLELTEWHHLTTQYKTQHYTTA
jgi:16S rRNA (adenine1518-N6/adenine1519-N6)-dimethyltransferase